MDGGLCDMWKVARVIEDRTACEFRAEQYCVLTTRGGYGTSPDSVLWEVLVRSHRWAKSFSLLLLLEEERRQHFHACVGGSYSKQNGGGLLTSIIRGKCLVRLSRACIPKEVC